MKLKIDVFLVSSQLYASTDFKQRFGGPERLIVPSVSVARELIFGQALVQGMWVNLNSSNLNPTYQIVLFIHLQGSGYPIKPSYISVSFFFHRFPMSSKIGKVYHRHGPSHRNFYWDKEFLVGMSYIVVCTTLLGSNTQQFQDNMSCLRLEFQRWHLN